MKLTPVIASLVMATGLVARVEGQMAPRPRQARVLCPRNDHRGVVWVVAPDADAWGRHTGVRRGDATRQKWRDAIPAGTEVEVVRTGVADGAIEIRVTRGRDEGHVGWVDRRDVTTPEEYERAVARAAQLAKEFQAGLDRIKSKRHAKRLHDARRHAAEAAAAAAESKAWLEHEAKVAPIRARQELESAHLEIQAANASANIARTEVERRDMMNRAIYFYGVPFTMGPQGRVVLYGQ